MVDHLNVSYLYNLIIYIILKFVISKNEIKNKWIVYDNIKTNKLYNKRVCI